MLCLRIVPRRRGARGGHAPARRAPRLTAVTVRPAPAGLQARIRARPLAKRGRSATTSVCSAPCARRDPVRPPRWARTGRLARQGRLREKATVEEIQHCSELAGREERGFGAHSEDPGRCEQAPQVVKGGQDGSHNGARVAQAAGVGPREQESEEGIDNHSQKEAGGAESQAPEEPEGHIAKLAAENKDRQAGDANDCARLQRQWPDAAEQKTLPGLQPHS